MLNFIHANQAAFAAVGTLIGTFVVIAYLNISYANEKKREAHRQAVEPIHGTCKYSNLNRGDANKAVDAVMTCLGNIAGTLIRHAADQRLTK